MATIPKDEEAGLSTPAGEGQPPAYQPDYGTTDNVPPSYEESHPLEPPPTYDSIYGKVKSAKQESKGFVEFLKKFFIILISSIGCTICIALVMAIPVAMIVIGAMFLHDCPRERFIPIYLIVAGCFGVVKNLSNIVQRVMNRKKDQEEENAKTNPLDGLIGCFLFAWFIVGNVWIYRIYNDFDTSPDNTNPRFCHPTLYYFAFWVTTATYILIFASCCCMICTGCIVGLCSTFT